MASSSARHLVMAFVKSSSTLSLAFALGACATARLNAQTFVAANSDGQPGRGPVPVQVVRYLGIDARQWPRSQAERDYSDLYTRVILISNDTKEEDRRNSSARRDYRAENRSWIARVLSGKTDTVTAVLNVSVTDPNITPDLKLAIPLFSFSHASGLKLGNSWDTVYTASDLESPLFRIGTDTTISIEASAKVSSDVKSQGTSLAVGALTTAIKTAAPAPKVLTTLSKEATNTAAGAIDTAISSLLSSDVAELVKSDREISTWEPGRQIDFDGCAPFIHETIQTPTTGICAQNIDLEGVNDSLVGRWAITIACPRLSIFSERDICTEIDPRAGSDTPSFKIADGVFDARDARINTDTETQLAGKIRNEDILAFHLTNQTTVQAYVLAQQWFTSFAAKSAPTETDYDALCSDAPSALRNSGLSTFDANLVLRAMIVKLPQLAKVRPQFAAGKLGAQCVDTLAQTGITVPRVDVASLESSHSAKPRTRR